MCILSDWVNALYHINYICSICKASLLFEFKWTLSVHLQCSYFWQLICSSRFFCWTPLGSISNLKLHKYMKTILQTWIYFVFMIRLTCIFPYPFSSEGIINIYGPTPWHFFYKYYDVIDFQVQLSMLPLSLFRSSQLLKKNIFVLPPKCQQYLFFLPFCVARIGFQGVFDHVDLYSLASSI